MIVLFLLVERVTSTIYAEYPLVQRTRSPIRKIFRIRGSLYRFTITVIIH
nr:MAG TPA: hypothetical protein [Crassvirales sp.]